MVNPYDPQNPAKPDYFGGRKEVLRIVHERIEKAKSQRQSGGILVYGYRGVGKTSLVKKIADTVEQENSSDIGRPIAVYRPLSKTTSDSELYQIITESVIEEALQKATLLEKMKSAAKSVSAIKIPNVVELQTQNKDADKSPYYKWRSIVRNIRDVDYILIAIDDADYLSIEALGNLKSIVEGQNDTPVLLVVSGGIEFEQRLVNDYSPIARIFSGASFNLGEFTPDETKEVVEKPVEGTGTRWSEAAISELQKLSRGYPYLVQCLASASYLENAEITQERVSGSLHAALDIGKPWLNNELRAASDIDIESFMKISALNSETIKSSEMGRLGVSAPYIGRLVQQGIIEKLSRGRYKLKKSPIIALYHTLKRGLARPKNP